MNKRGQITLFIILAVVIVIGVIFYFIFLRSSAVDTIEGSAAALDGANNVESAQSYFERCSQDLLENGAVLLAAQSGYLNPSDTSLFNEGDQIDTVWSRNALVPYVLDGNSYSFPYPLRVLEYKLCQYTGSGIKPCFQGFLDSLDAQGFALDVGEADVSCQASINEEGVSLRLSYPLPIEIAQSRATLTDAYVDTPLRLKKLYELANLIITHGGGDASYGNRIRPDQFMEVFMHGDVVIIQDYASSVGLRAFFFQFAVR
ncbi:MAG: hypothetical protein ABIC95_04705 [archaeon]